MRKPDCSYLMIWLVLFGFAALPQAHATDTVAVKILTEEYPPLNFMADGKVTGQATEVVRELLQRTDTEADIRMVTWEEGYTAVLARPNTALYSVVMTPERKDRLRWMGPIGALETNLYALKGSGSRITHLEEAKNVPKISTVAGYYSEQALTNEGFTNLESSASEKAALRKMLNGEAQLFVSTNTAMPAALEQVGATMDDVERVFTLSTDLTYVAFSLATSADLVDHWQETLNKMKRDGTFQEMYTRWLPAETPPGILQMMTEEYPPITFMKGGKPAGIVTDLVRAIAARQHIPATIRLTSWKNAYTMALLHPNVVLFSAERTPEREPLFHWVGPVGKNKAIFYTKKGAGISVNSLEEAREVAVIATTTNWFTEQYLQEKGFPNLRSSPDPTDNVRKLMDGEVQLSIFTDLTVPEIVKNAGYSMDDLEPVLTVTHTDFYIAMSRDTSAEVVHAWQATLDSFKKDGTFARLYRRYLPSVDLDELLQH